MAWDRTLPNDDTKVKAADDAFRANFSALEDALAREHIFAGDAGSAEGQHNPGIVGVIYVGSTSACSVLASKEGSGALCYDSTSCEFKIWDGSVWVAYDHIKTAGDTLIVDWTVPGSFIDGRDPSVDGAKLDNIAPYGDYVEIAEIDQADHEDVIPVLDGFTKEQCHVFIHNCGYFNLSASATYFIKDLYCWTHDPAAAPASTGFQVLSQVGFGAQGNATVHYMDAYVWGVIIGIQRTA